METYTYILLTLHFLAILFDEKDRTYQLISLLVFLPFYNLVLGWW